MESRFQVRPERASLGLKGTQLGSGSQPGLCATHCPCPPDLAASWFLANKLPQDLGIQHQREVTIKAYQTACRRQPQISAAK